MIKTKITLAVMAALAANTPALAHDGDHSSMVLANIMHWLSSPSHSLFAVIGGGIIAGIIIKRTKKKA